MKTASQQFSDEIEILMDSIGDVQRKIVNKTLEVLERTPPTPKTAQYSMGDFSQSHVISINGAQHKGSLSPGTKIKLGDKITITNPLHYAANVLLIGWDGSMPGVWPGAKHPAYRTYDVAVDEMKALHIQGIIDVTIKGTRKK